MISIFFGRLGGGHGTPWWYFLVGIVLAAALTAIIVGCTQTPAPPPCTYNTLEPGQVFRPQDYPTAYKTWVSAADDWYTREWAWHCEFHRTTHRVYLDVGDTIQSIHSW